MTSLIFYFVFIVLCSLKYKSECLGFYIDFVSYSHLGSYRGSLLSHAKTINTIRQYMNESILESNNKETLINILRIASIFDIVLLSDKSHLCYYLFK